MPKTSLHSIAVIPARGGSKGVPGKNTRLLDGKPLIAYAIEVARQCVSIERVIVNTDDENIAAIAQEFGAEVLMRTPGHAEDDSPVLPVIVDTLIHANNTAAVEYDIVVLLQPTAPLRTAADIENVISMFTHESAPAAVVSVVPVGDNHPARMYALADNNEMISLHPAWETSRRQDLQPFYLRNGCIYAITSQALIHEKTLMPSNKQAYIMPAEWLANIDTERDFILTELLMKEWKKQQ